MCVWFRTSRALLILLIWTPKWMMWLHAFIDNSNKKNRFIILLQYLFSKCIQSSTTCLICTIWCVRSAAILSVAIYIIFATWFQFVCVANTSLVCGHRQSRTNNFLFFELCKREKTAHKISTRSRVRHKRHHRKATRTIDKRERTKQIKYKNYSTRSILLDAQSLLKLILAKWYINNE